MEMFYQAAQDLLKPGLVALLFGFALWANRRIFKRIQDIRKKESVYQKLVAFALVLFGVLAVVISLPIDKSDKSQILSFLGIVVSAGIALSSTTILGNLMAGFMNNSMQRFKEGDLIKISDFHGRVVKKSAFHAEIQLEDSNFVTIPNLFIAQQAVKLTRKSNTVISLSVSLGYDVPRNLIENCLKEAALATGLKDPFVYITSLGDYSVVYKIHGFLDDSSKYFSTSSALHGHVMDALHTAQIEIVSPAFANQRRLADEIFIPEKQNEKQAKQSKKNPEKLVFDQAIESEKLQDAKNQLEALKNTEAELKQDLKKAENTDKKDKLKQGLAKNETQQKVQAEKIEALNKEIEAEKNK